MTADILLSYLFSADWLLLSGFALMIATVAVVEMGQEVWAPECPRGNSVPVGLDQAQASRCQTSRSARR